MRVMKSQRSPSLGRLGFRCRLLVDIAGGLLLKPKPGTNVLWQRVHRVDAVVPVPVLARAEIPEQIEPREAEEGVKDVGHVVWPVRDASPFVVLALQNEALELLRVDPVHFVQDAQRAEDPPAVAHVRLLLRSAVEAPRVALSLGKPPTQQLRVAVLLELAGDLQRTNAAEDLPRVRLGPRHGAEAAVKIAALSHEIRRCGHVHRVHLAQDGQRTQRTVGEAGVHLPPLVALEAAICQLQACDIRGSRRSAYRACESPAPHFRRSRRRRFGSFSQTPPPVAHDRERTRRNALFRRRSPLPRWSWRYRPSIQRCSADARSRPAQRSRDSLRACAGTAHERRGGTPSCGEGGRLALSRLSAERRLNYSTAEVPRDLGFIDEWIYAVSKKNS
eukprot:scaffold1384_cov256-Pinguiococcus_pyrenoidosus.AAC.3